VKHISTIKSTEGIKDFYENRVGTPRKNVFRQLEKYWAESVLEKNSEILELGIGTGFITGGLKKFGKVTGVDYSTEMLKKVKKKFKGEKILFVQSDLFKLDLGKKFDFVVSFRVLLHFESKQLAEAIKVIEKHLKPGGKAVFDVESESFLKFLWAKKRKFFDGKNEVKNPQYSFEDIKTAVEKARGLKIANIEAVDHLSILAPLFVLNQIFNSEKLSRLIILLDLKLRKLRVGNTRWVVFCIKK